MSYKVLCSSILWSVLYLVIALLLIFDGHQSLAGLVQVVWLMGLLTLSFFIYMDGGHKRKNDFIVIFSSFLITLGIFLSIITHYKVGF